MVKFGNSRDDTTIHLNEAPGYLLRSKPFDQNEGGVLNGQGVIDSIFFLD